MSNSNELREIISKELNINFNFYENDKYLGIFVEYLEDLPAHGIKRFI